MVLNHMISHHKPKLIFHSVCVDYICDATNEKGPHGGI